MFSQILERLRPSSPAAELATKDTFVRRRRSYLSVFSGALLADSPEPRQKIGDDAAHGWIL